MADQERANKTPISNATSTIFYKDKGHLATIKNPRSIRYMDRSPFSTDVIKQKTNLADDYIIPISDRIKVKLYLPKTGK